MSKRTVTITLDDDVFAMADSLRNNRELSPLINNFLRGFVEGKDFDLQELEELKEKKEEYTEVLTKLNTKIVAIESKKKKLQQTKLNEMRNMVETFKASGGISRILRENQK